MEFDDITKFASRKRINEDAEKLHEKVSRQTENVIKLKVAHDTAFWDLKENLQQVHRNHESLQQNMAEVQMQNEATNSKYQDELRQRPEILNKLSSTRKICDVLQESSERLRETLSRCKADGATLYHAFNRSAEQLRELQHKQRQADEKTKHQIERLQEKVSLSSNHHSQLVQYLTSAKQQADGELAEARAQLAVAHARKDDLLTALGDMNRDLDKHKHEIAKKDEMLTTTQSEMKRITDEYNLQRCNANKTLAQKEKEIQEAMEAYTSLKQALSNQEQFTKSVCDERNALQEKVAELEEEQSRLVAFIDTLKIQIQETISAKATVEKNLDKFTNENNDLKKEIFDYIQELTNKKQEVEDLQMQINELKKEKTQMASELCHSKNDSDEKCSRIEQLLTEKKLLEEHIVEMESAAKTFKEITEDKQKDMETKLQTQDKEIETKTNAINRLISEMKSVTDAKFKLEDTLHKLKKDIELERDVMKEKEEKSDKQIKMLQNCVREKEAELSQNMSMIFEIRDEKERLLEKIQDMQQTIDNVQKELTGRRRPPASRVQPELDDNAVMLTPSRTKSMREEPVQEKLQFVKPAAPEAVTNHDSLLDMFSDISDDGKVNDGVVKRCFAAISRGETLPRSTLAALKQRPNHNQYRNQKQKDQFAQKAVAKSKEDIKTRQRKFFKHKRLEGKE